MRGQGRCEFSVLNGPASGVQRAYSFSSIKNILPGVVGPNGRHLRKQGGVGGKSLTEEKSSETERQTGF